jgi:histidinol-phosphate/aromatic aminotransferase/cobyric acid decarboxylase-like protein
MPSLVEKGGATFEGPKLLLCENPLPPIDEAIAAAQAEAPRGNYYTEPYSAPLRRLIAEQLKVPERLIHVNAALATLQHEEKIRERIATLRAWTDELANDLRGLGVRTYPTETYFFLADFAPRDATRLAERLREQQILVKPLNDRRLGLGFMRVTTARPEDNRRFVQALRALL